MKYLRILLCGVSLLSGGLANAGTTTIAVTPGVGQSYQVITNGGGAYISEMGVCDGAAAAQCAAVKAASTAAGATDPALVVAISPNNTVAVTATQATAASLNATVVGTGTFAVQLSGATNNINNIAGTITLPTLASTSTKQSDGSQKTQIVDGSGNVIASTTNALNVNCANCSGSGVSTTDAATFTAGTSLFAGSGGQFVSGGATACVTGHQCQVGMTAARAFLTDLSSQAGTAITSAPSAYGTAPTGNVIGVNAFVTNTNANGQATMANSSPVVIASNQSNLPTNTAQVNGVTVLTGTGATGTGAQRVTVSTDQATNAGAALVKGGVGVVNGGNFFQAVAASQTATTLQQTTGAAGDYLSHCDIYPTSTSPGVVTVFDNTNTAANSVVLFAGGATSLSNLAPIPVPVGAVSVSGAWKVTTGTGVSVVCYGRFS